jgi:hypothetical protein
VYSRAGIHPQCAVRQADPPRPKDKGPKKPDQPEVDAIVPPKAEMISPADPLSVSPATPIAVP